MRVHTCREPHLCYVSCHKGVNESCFISNQGRRVGRHCPLPFNWKTQSCSYGEGMQLGGCCRGLILLSGEAGLTSDSCPHSALRRLCTPISARSAVRAGFLGLRDWAEMEGRTAEEALHRGLPHTQVTEQILLGLEHRFEGGRCSAGEQHCSEETVHRERLSCWRPFEDRTRGQKRDEGTTSPAASNAL